MAIHYIKIHLTGIVFGNYNRFLYPACFMLFFHSLTAQPAADIPSLQQIFLNPSHDTAAVNAALRLGLIYFSSSSDSFLFYNGWAETFSLQKLSENPSLNEKERRFYQRAISVSLREMGPTSRA